MKNPFVNTQNYLRMLAAVKDLIDRPHGTEGMGLLYGDPGLGKTTAICKIVNLFDGVYLRAMGCWTVTSMLGAICRELGGERKLRRADMVEYIVQQLAENPRPIFIDEADYVVNNQAMIDTLRDIYDFSGCPVILVGMENIARKVQNHGRLARRITQWIEFTGITLDDARNVAHQCCEVIVSADLLNHLHSKAQGNIGRIIIGLTKIENVAKASNVKTINLDLYGEQTQLFFDQPKFSRRPQI